MATVQTSEGVQSVAPSAEAPNDYQRIQSSPTEFGSAIGAGAEKAGAAVSQAGQFWGQIQTDGSLNTANQAGLDIVEKYKGLKGADALSAQADTQKQLDQTYNDARAKLSTPAQQREFDNQSRSFRQRFLDAQLYSHANDQATVYAKNTNEDKIKQAYDLVAANPDDDDKADDALKMAMTGAGQNAHLVLGNTASVEATDAYMRPYLQNFYKTRAQALSVKDPERAVKFLDDNRDRIGADYPALSAQFRARSNEQQALGIVDQSFQATAQRLQTTPERANNFGITEAILQQESGNKGPNPGQVQPGTFAQYAKPGEDFNNPGDKRVVAMRIVDDLSQKYGGDPARVAVGYFSGPGNVAPVGSPQPYIADLKDANGKSVSSYVSDITQRLGANGPMLAAKAGAYDDILTRTAGNPQLRQIALTEVDRRYRAAEVADLADQKATKAAQDAALRNYGDLIRSGKAGTPWHDDHTLNEEQVEHLDQLQIATLNGPKGDYGRNFSAIQNRILDPESPDPIRSRAQILQEFHNGNLTPAGVDEAGKKLDWAAKPENYGDRVLSDNFFKSAQRAVTHLNEMMKTQMPGTDEKWTQALPVLIKALQEGRDGKTTGKPLTDAEMMDPNSKNSVWPVLKPFLPSQAESTAWDLNHDVSTDHPGVSGPVDLSTQDGLKDAVRAGHITRADGEAIARGRGWIGGPPAVPTSETQASAAYSGPDVHDLAAPVGYSNPDQWDKRADGSLKGNGFLGLLRRPDGKVSSEISVGVNIGGKEVEIPTMVPTLTRAEVETLLSNDPAGGVPQPILDKAVDFAKKRIAAGKSPFAGPDESPDWNSRLSKQAER